MNAVFNHFLRVLEKIDTSAVNAVQLIDRGGQIIAKSRAEAENIAEPIVQSMLQAVDDSKPRKILYDNSGEYTVVAVPVAVNLRLFALILVETMNLKSGEQVANTLRASLEAFIEHLAAQHQVEADTDRDAVIIKEILETETGHLHTASYKIFRILKTYNIDLFLLRSVILIQLEKKTNDFFNINLDLGYEASIKTFKDNVVQVIKNNKYLNNQDLVAFADNDHIVVIKSFLSNKDIGRLYYALDIICQGIIHDLDAAKIFTYRVAYGRLYSNFLELVHSYTEAKKTIYLGELFQDNPGLYSADQGLLEHINYYLPHIIRHKSISPVLAGIKKEGGNPDLELLQIIEAYIDQNTNLTKTASLLHLHRNTIAQKVDRFKKKTGLDPENSFKDAFIIKMAALTVKLNKS
ncbi:PucR family transcriptional regulator [Sporomusa termitida]|uniref:PucR C-terminal helix-turn-helix domain protein n=1 Tax=Sporomusa termitida TaxID=2377 RepID=A0A517DYQ8_9FIRM|nr:helix-turn-helix domain-containing protein [Sporomusa termitida]QDR82473.1 hypothetical protein SPTER_39010 [Sporomusa termitida]